METPFSPPPAKAPSKENPLLNLLLNVIVPVVILSKFSSESYLGPVYGLILALSFPLIYGVYDLIKRRKWNFFSLLGLISILLSGGIGLLKIDTSWMAVKEAAIPLAFGLIVLGSLKIKKPLAESLLYQDTLFNKPLIQLKLQMLGRTADFERLFRFITLLLSASFFLSALLNYILAKAILHSPSGTTAFNEEMGKMTALSFPVITLPSMLVMALALWRLIHGLKKLTGLQTEEILPALAEQKK